MSGSAGDGDILEDSGIRLQRSNQKTCQLYSGHRGAGKSTELLRLKDSLEKQKFYVVYFAADEEDIESEDAQYTDILLACTRHLLEDLQKSADTGPLRNWLKSRWQELKDLALTVKGCTQLAVIADNLDRIAPIIQEGGDCHLIYTVPSQCFTLAEGQT